MKKINFERIEIFVDIKTEDAALLKEICSNFFTAGVYGQIYDLIEGGRGL